MRVIQEVKVLNTRAFAVVEIVTQGRTWVHLLTQPLLAPLI